MLAMTSDHHFHYSLPLVLLLSSSVKDGDYLLSTFIIGPSCQIMLRKRTQTYPVRDYVPVAAVSLREEPG